MENNKSKKHLVIGIVGIVLVSLFVGVNLFKSKPEEIKEKTISKEETRSMLSYTLDGEKTDIKPTKDSGYIANKIICENGSNLIWDNTNWEVEIIKLESNDICSVDFTTNASTSGYRVNATTNVEGSIDSLSKTTIENGTIIFYPNKGQEITGVSGCTGVVENNRVVVNNVTYNQTCKIEVKLPTKNLYTLLSDGNKYEIGTRTDFSTPVGGTEITQGYNNSKQIYKVGNDYYFAGNPSDNWVKMVKEDNTELWWRIIRTNSSEGTRLLYAGTSHDGQDGYINNTTYQWNSNTGVIYAQYNQSQFRDILKNWYDVNIDNNTIYKNLINKNSLYCNDISNTLSGTYTLFGAYNRLVNVKQPTYICNSNGNTTETYIGLMTADEISFAGGVFQKNAPNTYYYRNSLESGCVGTTNNACSVTGDKHWWTMSPLNFDDDGRGRWVNQFYVHSVGVLESYYIHWASTLRPVITLKPEVKVTGEGTTDKPYVPSL